MARVTIAVPPGATKFPVPGARVDFEVVALGAGHCEVH